MPTNINTFPRSDSANRWEDWLNLLLACSLFISPWTLQIATGADYNPVLTVAVWNAFIAGTVIVVVAAMAIFQLKPWKEWTNAAVGVWVAASPWALGFSDLTAMMWNTVIVGLLVFCLAAWNLYELSATSAGGEARI
jgi:hypothetical protein